MLKKAFLMLILVVLTGCSGTGSPGMKAETDRPNPTEFTYQPTQPPEKETAENDEPTWIIYPGAANLLQDASWACKSGESAGEGRVLLKAGESYLTILNSDGAYWFTHSAFGVSVDLEIVSGRGGALTLLGKLPQGSWWQGMRRLDLGWDRKSISATYWDGNSSNPIWSQVFEATHSADRSKIQLGLRVLNAQLSIRVDGQEVGNLDDPGIFQDGWVYTGANVPPGSILALENLSLETLQGEEAMLELHSSSRASNYQPTTNPLRMLAQERGLYIGAAVAPTPLRCDPDYALALGHEFNLATPENALKFGPVHPQPETYAFEDADAIIAFALENQMIVRGHVLVWHQQNPVWIANGSWTKDSLEAALQEHIQTVVGRYKGKILYWDVINEAVEARGFRDTLWLRTLGQEYLDKAFLWTHETDPDAKLFYNDYNSEGMSPKSDQVYELVKGMLERGVPVHGVGLQLHIPVNGVPYGLQENMQRLGDLGLEVHVTELDVRIDGQATAAKLQAQADTYLQVLEACLNVAQCKALILWGLTDAYSWVPGTFKGWGSALIFDEQYQPKPAYNALQEILKNK